MFGNKYISFLSPAHPSADKLKAGAVINAASTTTEFNTLFETVVDVAEQVDPIKLNQTLAATAEALSGLGDRFGQSIIHGNEILADINPKMPQLRRDNQRLADLGDVYANAAPDLFDGWGIRSLSAEHVSYNPFAYHLGAVWPVEQPTFALGFKRYGLDAHVARLVEAMLRAAAASPHGRLPEALSGHGSDDVSTPVPYPAANAPQAWSASARKTSI